ncbi:FxLYD domain-containing protein [Dapis sp. BLCC M229]|uniref:FxLYD domain-containing protein n=1 Tax=Dapis sp. BLCC M229 TaxID=3400188 RepID=UPI003CF328AA
MKYFYFTILIPLLHGGVERQLLQSNMVNILAQKSEFNNPICYMETTEGKIINLVNLCGNKEAIDETPKVACKSEEIKATEIPISNVNYDGNFLTGKVTNKSCQTVKLIKVNYQVLDDEGNIIDNGYIYAQPATVEPGKVASFKSNVSPGAKVETTFVEWSN